MSQDFYDHWTHERHLAAAQGDPLPFQSPEQKRIVELEAEVAELQQTADSLAHSWRVEVEAAEARITELEWLLEEIRNGDPGVENMPRWKRVMGES